MRRALPALAAAVAVLASGCGGTRSAGHGRHLVVGGVEDSAKWSDPSGNMARAHEAGFRVVVLSSVWHRGHWKAAADELGHLRDAVTAAQGAGITPIVAVYFFGRETPHTPRARAQFASYAGSILRAIPELRDMSVGNEPNSPTFWQPQFGPGGADAAAAGYFALLAKTYDLLKRIDPKVTVIGCSLAARGSDRAQGRRPSHSPTRFLEDIGRAFRASGRSRAPLDLFSIHPYPPNSSVPPTATDPRSTAISIADYPKLVALLDGAFGTPPPIAYGEYGIETRIPRAELDLYSGTQPRPVRPVPETVQAADYVEAIRLAACQPLVRMLVFFHVTDESQFTGLQTGLFYPNERPKRSFRTVAAEARAAESGRVQCSP